MMTPNYDSFKIGKRDGVPECAACKQTATHCIRVKNGWFRGDDDFYDICIRHLKMYLSYKNQDRFWAHVRTKDKFFNNESGAS
jgi:hypothetical protein